MVVRYQAVFDLASRAVTKFEALTRPTDSFEGITSYVARAERDGSIKQYTNDVLDATLKDWRTLGRTDIGLSLNLAIANLTEPDLIKRVEKALKRYRIGAQQLWFEVDARAQMISDVAMLATMKNLTELGVRFSIDSFGDDYSAATLYEVARLPLAELKVAPLYVADSDTDMTHRNLVAHTVGMAHQQGLRICAKGIERENIAALMLRIGCTHGQGYYLAHPVGIDSVPDILETAIRAPRA